MPKSQSKHALICWFTGLSGAGKSTVAERVQRRLAEKCVRVLILDGDFVREKMHRHLGFSAPEIIENNRLIAEYCAKARDRYDVILVPIISPYKSSRRHARKVLEPHFYEIYCAANLSIVSERDVKGLYQKAGRGEVTNLIGFSPESPYEPPSSPDLILDTESETLDKSVGKLARFIQARFVH